jgi:tetratricopeptide (TPR) repeat protein
VSAVDADGIATRHPDLVLARLHLRLGSLALARAELETLAGQDALDEDGLVDLAEARWRTGDIAGAGEAAVAALNEEEGPLVALVVAAEAAAARGRPTEARRLADKAMEAAAGTIDAIFAGMPRAGVWPPDAAAPPPSPTTMFDPPRRLSASIHRHPIQLDASSAADAEAAAAAAAASDVAGESGAILDGAADAPTVGLWEAADSVDDAGALPEAADTYAQPEAGAQPDVEAWRAIDAQPDLDAQPATETSAQPMVDASPELPVGDLELDLGRAALEAGDPDEAAVRLGIALRVAPALAPAVLDVVAGRTERSLVLVRGDAYRLVGRETEAQRAYAEAARGAASPPPAAHHDGAVPDASALSHDPTDPPTDDPSEGDPA